MLALTSRQRKFLRGLAHPLRATVQVGRHGVTEEVVQAVNRELLQHELIKVKMHEPPDKKAIAARLAEQTGSEMCGLIGHVVILYRPHPEEPQIELP